MTDDPNVPISGTLEFFAEMAAEALGRLPAGIRELYRDDFIILLDDLLREIDDAPIEGEKYD